MIVAQMMMRMSDWKLMVTFARSHAAFSSLSFISFVKVVISVGRMSSSPLRKSSLMMPPMAMTMMALYSAEERKCVAHFV